MYEFLLGQQETSLWIEQRRGTRGQDDHVAAKLILAFNIPMISFPAPADIGRPDLAAQRTLQRDNSGIDISEALQGKNSCRHHGVP